MIDTITPAGCGGRHRRVAALAAFGTGAVLAAAALGAALGALGALLGADALVVALAVAGLAVVAAAREAGLLRLGLPQVRRQVPERWRREWPLPAWSAAYGAGLGAGALTHQTVATFWVACAAAVWLADPVTSALALAAFGAGRAAMAALPARRVGGLLRLRPVLLRLNVVALVACAVLVLVPAASAAARPDVLNLGPGSQDDPSFSNGVLAFTQRGPAAGVVVAPAGRPRFVVAGASGASLDGDLLAYRDSTGIAVVDWRTGVPAAHLDDATADRPALDWPWLAFRRQQPNGARALVLRDVTTGVERIVTVVRPGDELSRPALAAGFLAWSATTRSGSAVRILQVPWGVSTRVRTSRTLVLTAPAISARSVGWVERDREGSSVVVQAIVDARRQTILRLPGATRTFVALALEGRGAWASYWDLRRRFTRIVRVGY